MAELKPSIMAEDKQAKLEMWKYVLGFTPMAVVKCAVELRLADVIAAHGGTMTHADLSAAVSCSPPVLRRIMRYLVHRRFFNQTTTKSPKISYALTPLSRQLMFGNGADSMAALVLLESTPIMLAPWHRLSLRAREDGGSPFAAEHGRDLWGFTNSDREHSKLVDDAMSSIARVSMAAIVEEYAEAFEGVGSVVDVGGGNGTAMGILVKAFPWIDGVNFDVPHVVGAAPEWEGVRHVAGNMFDGIPKADAAFLMSVLHDWNDEECIEILRKCMEAIPKERGKVMIVEAVMDEKDEDKYSDVRLALDMVMLAHTTGKERSWEEWKHLLTAAGFTTFTVKHIDAIPAVIQAYP